MTIETKSFEHSSIASKFEECEQMSLSKETQTAFVAVLHSQSKLIRRLLHSNQKLKSEIQQCKKTEKYNKENIPTSQIIMQEIWDNPEDDMWDKE